MQWEVEEDGIVIQNGESGKLNIQPLSELTVQIPIKRIEKKSGAEYRLKVRFLEPEDNLWARKGSEIAWDQMKMPLDVPKDKVLILSKKANPEIIENDNSLSVIGDAFQIKFDKSNGIINSIKYNDKEYLSIKSSVVSGPKLQLFRAPLDNDRTVQNDWVKYKFNEMKSSLIRFDVSHGENNTVRIETDISYQTNYKASLLHKSIYTVLSNGDIAVENTFVYEGKFPTLPKAAVSMILSPEFEQLKWYGRGPNENYSDRKTGAAIGQYSSTVEKQYFPYVKPQATGSKQDVRWLLLSDSDQNGLMIVNNSYPFSFSALHYSQEALSLAKHTSDLQHSDEIFLNINASERGVGNASCGPELLEQYEVKAKPLYFSYSIRAIHGKVNSAGELARKRLPVVSTPMVERDNSGKVTIESASGEDMIYYTLDGSKPTKRSKRYVVPFKVSDERTIKAIVISNNLESKITTLETDKLKLLPPAVMPQNVYFTDSIKIYLTNENDGADIYYTLDGTDPNDGSKKYRGQVYIQKSCLLKAVSYKKELLVSDIVTSDYKKVDSDYGIRYQYYIGHFIRIPNFLKLTSKRKAVVDSFSLNKIENNGDHFALLMFGSINIEEEGEFIFYVGSNDGSQLTVDNKQIINNDGEHGYQVASGKISLEKGRHSLKLSYFQSGGDQELRVFWKGPGFQKREMTEDDLSGN
jgi:beta-galactosidase